MAAIRKPDKERFWRDKLSLFEKTGLSLPAFCKQEGINKHTFKSWIFIIKGRDGEEASEQLKARLSTGRRLSEAEIARKRRKQRAVVKKWKKSGLTQADFCRKEGIREQQLSAWKLEYEKDNSKNEDGAEEFVSVRLLEPVQRPQTFAKVLPCSHANPTIRMTHPVAKVCCDKSIVVLAGADADTLRALFVAFKENLL